MEFQESKVKKNSPLELHLQDVIDREGFIASEIGTLYTGKWYDGRVRSVVIAGEYEGKPAVIKAYNDPRPSNQPKNLAVFNTHNRSSILHAPKLFASETESETAGWMIMQRVPEKASILSEGQLSAAQRKELLSVYCEYRTHFPTDASAEEKVVLLGRYAEYRLESPDTPIDAAEYHAIRFKKWRTLAETQDQQHEQSEGELLLTGEVAAVCDTAEQYVASVFAGKEMILCHGHIKSNEIHKVSDSEYWITDFGHVDYKPQGYELVFMIWADVLMHSSFETSAEVMEAIEHWITDFYDVVGDATGENLEGGVLEAALAERLIGTIYADIIANATMPIEQKQKKLALVVPVLQELLP